MDRSLIIIDTDLQGSTITFVNALRTRSERYSAEEHMPVLNALWELMDARMPKERPTIGLSELEKIRQLHARSEDTVEIEVWHEKGDPECDRRAERFGECEGHERHIYICNACGVGTDATVDGVVWLEWPCATAKMLGLDQADV